MRFLTLGEVMALHRAVVTATGGSQGLRDLGLLESALAQPKATFGGMDLQPTLSDKAASLCASLVQNHPFVDGNKRIGHAAMEAFLMLNGFEITADTDEQEQVILNLAQGTWRRHDLAAWLENHLTPLPSTDDRT